MITAAPSTSHALMPSQTASEALKSYLPALPLVGLALALRVGFLPAASDPGLVYWLLPVLVATRWGGLGPGILATLLVGAGTLDLSALRAPAWLAHPIEPDLRWGILSLGVMISAVVEQRVPTAASSVGHDWLRAATEQLQEGLVVASLTGDLLHANRLGLAGHGLEGTVDCIRDRSDCLEVFQPGAPDRLLEPADWPLARILRGEELSGLELSVRRSDHGSTRRLRYSGRIVRDAGDRQGPLAVVTIQDVTPASFGCN